MYRERNFWQWLSAFILALLAAIDNTAYLSQIASDIWDWATQSGFLHELGIAIGRLLHLIEFTFRHLGWLFIALLIYWVFYARDSRF